MNILLHDISGINSELIDYLAHLVNTSLYLSLSGEDTIRIIKDIKPELVILGQHFVLQNPFVQLLGKLFPELSIYLYDGQHAQSNRFNLVNYRNTQYVILDEVISAQHISQS